MVVRFPIGMFWWFYLFILINYAVSLEDEPCTNGKWTYFKETDSCYHLNQGKAWEKLTWYEADDYCALFNAHLVSIHSKQEDKFLLDMARKKDPLWSSTYWIGLHALGMDGQFEWSDGTLTEYTNWQSNNPEAETYDKCVHVSVFSGKWKGGNCGLQVSGFFCKSPNAVRPTSRPTPLPTPIPGNCPKDWSGYGDKCFLFQGDSEDTKLSWREALKSCRSIGESHDLASIHSTGEQMFLTALMGRYRSAAWIGLSKLDGSFNNFGWSDNSKFDFQAWGPGEPNGYSEKCVRMMSTKRRTGQWDDFVCEKKQSYICQRYKDPQIPTPPPPETDCSLRGEGYVGYQSSCYKLVKKVEKTWFDAEDACVRESGHLVSVTNPYEQAFIHSMLVQTNETVWNGLYSHDAVDRFRWIDTWPVYYTNWGPRQPENPTINATRCVVFDKAKQWKVLSCQQASAFMCKVTDLIPPVIDIPSDSGTCPEHLQSWLNIQGPSCFHIEQESSNNQKSWAEASLFCRRKGAILAAFHSLHDLQVLQPYLQPEAPNLWIGLIEKHYGGYEWEDGSFVDFTYWAEGEPSNPDAQLCVEMYEHNLRWNDEVCSNRRGFICQVEKVPPKPTCETEDGRWKYFKDSDACYHVLKANWIKKYTWHDAEDYCSENGGHLVSIHSKEENDFIQKMIQERGNVILSSYWIGFHALGLDGQFEWTDRSLAEFINWDNENENFEAEEKCVIIIANSGTWRDHHCDLKEAGAVCKVANSKLVTPAPTVAPTPLPGNCPAGWYPLGDKCYLFSEENNEAEMTWQEAREACRKKGPNHDLVSVHSKKEQMFLTSMLAYSKKSAWIGLKRAEGQYHRFIWSDNSRFDFDYWAPREPNSYIDGCVEMMGEPPSAGKWNDRKCIRKAAYICQRYKDPSLPASQPPNHMDCSHLEQDYVGYRETCYKLFIEASQMKSWKTAEEFCAGQGGHLTSVIDLFDQAFLYSLLDVTTEYVWNGFHAKFDQDRFRWSDNWPVYYTKWTKGQPGSAANNNNNMRCVAFQETNEWTVVPCETKLSFVCKVTDLKPPIIDIPHISGSCPKNLNSWINIQGPYCFHFSTDRKSWINASVFCKKNGGSLASFHSMHELQLIQMYLADRHLGLWIGLLESHDGGYEWVNSVAADFFNWDIGEPSAPGKDHCVELKPQNMKWNDHGCSYLKNYVCMTRKEDYKIVTTTTTTTVGTVPEVLAPCDENHPEWKLFQGNCYLVKDILFWESHKKISWHAAGDFCRQNGAHLASIHSQGENDFIKLVGDKMNEEEVGYHSSYWIGLHALGFEGNLEWTDGSVLEFVNWEKDNENEISTDEEKCVIFNGESGKWTLNHCSLVESFVCKRPDGEPPTPIPTMEPPVVEGNCPKGWTSIKQSSKCFKFFGKKDQDKISWTDARSACRKMDAGGDLATIGNEEEQLLLTSMLLYNPFNVWIGLSKLSSAGITSRIFGWVDNTRVSFVNWAPGSPRYYWKRCVTMIAASIRSGKWIDSSCSENQGYVCQQYKDQNLPEQNVNYYCNGSLSNYVSYGQGCYRVYNSKNTWKDAEYYCQEEKGHLASVVSPYEQAFLHLFLKKTSSNTWIGFGSKTDENRFRWTDQWPVYFTNWGRGQPVTSTSSSQQLCVSFLKNGPWNVTSCEEKLPFVCKVNIDDPPIILEPVEGECPNNLTDWLDVEGHYCYYIDNKSVKQWGEASRKCLIQNATLASFHSEHELKIMQPYLSLAKTDLWIGLVQKADGGFRWMDYSPVDYTNWGEGEPNDVSVDHCVLLRTQDTTWKTMKCNVNVGHICMVKKVPGNSHKKEKDDEEHSSKVLASWAVVVICLSIVTLVAVITSLCFYRLKKISTSTKLPLSFDNIMHTSGSDTLSYPALSSSSSVTPPTS